MTTRPATKYGLLLPHFGAFADRDRLLEGSKLAESYGFDSVWVRDHLIFEPHGEMEDPNRNFFDALITLTAIGIRSRWRCRRRR
jgi:alkanesulfonate monooxygenase SsuD/methylene tetrahydromethanopterin reductase-like flavin-dependent oxidoreductase (luciferase family)